MNFESIHEYFLQKQGCEESFPFDEHTLVFKVGNKMFGLMSLKENPPRINLKCDPERCVELRASNDWILPGYHMNKKHWNTIVVDANSDDSLILALIDHSYNLVFSKLSGKAKSEISIS